MITFPILVQTELVKARAKHRCIESRHEAVAVILEEFEEFKESVFRDQPIETSLKELVQLAAICQRCAEDVPFVGEDAELANYSVNLGKEAYEAYCQHTGWKALATGADLPPWAGLNESIRQAWLVTAAWIVGRVMRLNGLETLQPAAGPRARIHELANAIVVIRDRCSALTDEDRDDLSEVITEMRLAVDPRR
jgi:hypothetical protein